MIAMMFSRSMNDISTSSCVNSACRSARGSSSRKQRTICMYLSHPADHQKLLEELRRLRKGIKTAGHKPRRHDEIPCAFRRRFGEERRLDFPETQVAQIIAHDLRHAISRAQRLLHLVAAKVDVAICQPLFLVDRLVLVRRERRRGRCAEHLHRLDAHFDFAGRQLGIDDLRRRAR